MKIRKIKFESIPYWEDLGTVDAICLLNFFNSKSFRICKLPEQTKNKEELIQVLNTICARYRNNVWYFNKDAVQDLSEILLEMDQMPLIIEPDKSFYN